MGILFPEGKIPTCKWVAFHGNNGSNFDDDGISSITRNSTGRYTMNFDGNMSSNDYALVSIGEYEYSCGTGGETHSAYSTSSAYIWHGRYGSGTSGDGEHMSVIIIGRA
tara:strand:- start:716 stop:1042 length:327 start_codon:yes stop_codon:yes gene_type:complete